MKIVCEHCNKDLQKQVYHQFEQFEVGYVICPHCQKKNKRYLSELDIISYFCLSSLMYTFGLILVFTMMNTFGVTWYVIAITLSVVTFMFFMMKGSCTLIFNKAFFRQNYRDLDMQEDQKNVQRRLKKEFMSFMIIAFVFGTQTYLLSYFPLMLLLFMLVVIWQITRLIQREKAIVLKPETTIKEPKQSKKSK